MGEAKKARLRFSELHPQCCFCGGEAPFEEYDEQPPRAFFVDRQWPEGFRFPSCSKCNRASRQHDLAVSLVGRICTPVDDAYREKDARNILTGIRNNAPHLLPNLHLSSNDKRRTLRDLGLSRPEGVSFGELPIVGIDGKIYEHIEQFLVKLTKALYYKEKDKILPTSACFLVFAQNNLEIESRDIGGLLSKDMQNLRRTERARKDLSRQFCYRWHYNVDEGLYAFAGNFAGAFLGVGACVLSADNIPDSQLSDWLDFQGRPLGE